MNADGSARWYPHVTVASIACTDDRYLMVRETCNGSTVFNQPAGHIEQGESLEQAVIRETLEETGWHFRPAGLVGIYQFVAGNGETYIRFAFSGELTGRDPDAELDPAIDEVVWLDRQAVEHSANELRSHVVLKCIDDYEAGKSLPAETVSSYGYGGGYDG